MFVVHREEAGLPNIEFLMQNSCLYYYEPPKNDLSFLETVSKNKEVYSKRQIKYSIKSRELQHTLVFPTVKEVKWIIRSNQIQYCSVEIEDMDNAEMIW